MNFDEIRQILDLVREHELSELELQQENFKIRVKKDGQGPGFPTAAAPGSPPASPSLSAGASGATAAPAVTDVELEPAGPVEATGLELAVVKSPIVGTFYRSQEAGLPPLVEVGSNVKRGQVLCIIEAMKLMNEIESEYDGVVSAVHVENGQPVQYGERLFAIRIKQ
ncbi:MAG: acetyl-CoA carboxylase biotin carboxyl carrier protein [Acidobacteria bacterium]|nr:acetyl-CoA carboxylase biotin carboxyl carrier protein [Acidobacteriota bacterium]MBI3263926.1 acetyl-CoA carboxylase biotin carboxyl carrier protein [Acidobacteriota bacterium]